MVYDKNNKIGGCTKNTQYGSGATCATAQHAGGTKSEIRRGDIFYADLSPTVGSEQGGMRPVLIVQNNTGNRFSPTVIVAAITSKFSKTKLPTHIEISADVCGLPQNSIILMEQVRTLDKSRLRSKVGALDEEVMYQVDCAIYISFGLCAPVVA